MTACQTFLHNLRNFCLCSFKYPSEDDQSSILSGSDPSGVNSSPQPQSGTLLNTVPSSSLQLPEVSPLSVETAEILDRVQLLNHESVNFKISMNFIFAYLRAVLFHLSFTFACRNLACMNAVVILLVHFDVLQHFWVSLGQIWRFCQVPRINLDPILNELRDQREVQQQLRESIEGMKVSYRNNTVTDRLSHVFGQVGYQGNVWCSRLMRGNKRTQFCLEIVENSRSPCHVPCWCVVSLLHSLETLISDDDGK